MKSANKDRELQSGMTAINHVVKDLRVLGSGSPDVDAYEASLANIQLARQVVDAAPDSPERQAAQKALQYLFEDFDQLSSGEREPDAEGVAASLAGALRAQSFIKELQPVITGVPHKLIHMDFESNRWLPRRNHDDHDHEKYVKRLEAFYLEQLEKGKLVYIAVIPAADGPQGLSEVFARSNSIEAPWVENNGVKLHPWLRSQRSTSVGDLIVVHDQVLMVDAFGFVNLSRLFEALQEKLIAPVDARLDTTPAGAREFDFTSGNGIPMRADLTLKGEPFANSRRKPHDAEDPIIRILDMRYAPDHGGDMISSYYLSTFLGCDGKGQGLCLDGGRPKLDLEAKQVRDIAAWAEDVLGITADRKLACNSAMAQIREALGGDLSKQMFSEAWITSTRDQLTGYFNYLPEGADWQKGVAATAVFTPGTDELVSLEVVDRQSNEVFARFEADEAPAIDLDRHPDFSM